jgi:hypothetical protein
MKKCLTCKYFKLINTQCKTPQDLFKQYCKMGKLLADCTIKEYLHPMLSDEQCRFTEEEFNKLEGK